MIKKTIKGWALDLPWSGGLVRVFFVLKDTFFDLTLYSCMACGALVGVDREREFYSGLAFEELRRSLACPECGQSLECLMPYPETFRYPNGEEGHVDPPRNYPPDSELVAFEMWDPYG